MKSPFLSAAIFSICGAVSSTFAVMDIPNAQPKVDAGFWNQVLDKTWNGLKKRNIKPYESSTKPSEDPGKEPDAIGNTIATPVAGDRIRLVRDNGKVRILRKNSENHWIEYNLNGKKLFKVQ